jgi:uncharacterized membrane protein YtjA (UPF0391 family)
MAASCYRSPGHGAAGCALNVAQLPVHHRFIPAPLKLPHADRVGGKQGGRAMLYYAVVFLVIALIAGVLGFTGIAGTAAGIAKILFLVFLILFVVSFLLGRRTPAP